MMKMKITWQNAVASATGVPLTTISSEQCSPSSWVVYTNISSHNPEQYFPPRLSNTGTVVLPSSFGLFEHDGVSITGVVSINSSLTFLTELMTPYVQPDVVIYVMGLEGGFPLLANSVGESLHSNGELVSATAATNTMIRQSALYWSTHPIPPSPAGTSAIFNGTDGLEYVSAASNYQGHPAVNWLIVAVTFGRTSSAHTSGSGSASGAVVFGPAQVSNAIVTTAKSSLSNIIRYSNSLLFLTGMGPQPLSTPIVISQPLGSSSANKNSVTRQALWGSLNAFEYNTQKASAACGLVITCI